jgi:hypothetical protein
MRLNLFQYHVQDREYSAAEAVSLINNSSTSKHNILSGGNKLYSMGTVAEVVKSVSVVVASIATFAYVLYNISNSEEHCEDQNPTHHHNYHSGYYSDYHSGYYAPTININVAKQPEQKIRVADLRGEKFSGAEVTKFMNEYYNYTFLSSDIKYDQIIDDFISHKYYNEIVPTSGNSSISDIAVLDLN